MKRRKQAIEISLFPFLSILACVIGVLVLLICLVVLSSIDKSGVEATKEQMLKGQKNSAAFKLAKQQAADLERMIEAVRTDLSRVNDPINLAALAAERDALKANLNNIDIATVPASLDIAPLDAELVALRGRAEQGRLSLQKIDAELDQRKAGPAPARVRVQPSGSGGRGDIAPTFVECTASSLVIHAKPNNITVPRAQVATHKEWIATLKRVAEQAKGTVIFLIREDGISTYRAASTIAANHYCRNGKLPVSGAGELDFSAFNR